MERIREECTLSKVFTSFFFACLFAWIKLKFLFRSLRGNIVLRCIKNHTRPDDLYILLTIYNGYSTGGVIYQIGGGGFIKTINTFSNFRQLWKNKKIDYLTVWLSITVLSRWFVNESPWHLHSTQTWQADKVKGGKDI